MAVLILTNLVIAPFKVEEKTKARATDCSLLNDVITTGDKSDLVFLAAVCGLPPIMICVAQLIPATVRGEGAAT